MDTGKFGSKGVAGRAICFSRFLPCHPGIIQVQTTEKRALNTSLACCVKWSARILHPPLHLEKAAKLVLH